MLENFGSYDHDEMNDILKNLLSPEFCAIINQQVGFDVCQSIPCITECYNKYHQVDFEDENTKAACVFECLGL